MNTPNPATTPDAGATAADIPAAVGHECEVGLARLDGVDAAFGVIIRPGPGRDLDHATAELVGTGVAPAQAAAWLRHIADHLASGRGPDTHNNAGDYGGGVSGVRP